MEIFCSETTCTEIIGILFLICVGVGTFICVFSRSKKCGNLIHLVHNRPQSAANSQSVSEENTNPGIKFFQQLEIIRKIGDGATANVYNGQWGPIEVAVKVFKNSIDFDREDSFIQRAKLNHENIINIFWTEDVKRPSQGPGLNLKIISEYSSLGSLAKVLKQNTLTKNELINVTRGIFQGLTYLHHGQNDNLIPYNVAHRDIKPDNILLWSNLIPIIADFGFSVTKTSTNDTMPKVMSKQGTVRYMSPELLELNNDKIMTKSFDFYVKGDMYAAGLVLSEMVNRTALDDSNIPPKHDEIFKKYLEKLDYNKASGKDEQIQIMHTFISKQKEIPLEMKQDDDEVMQIMHELAKNLVHKLPALRPSGSDILARVRTIELIPLD